MQTPLYQREYYRRQSSLNGIVTSPNALLCTLLKVFFGILLLPIYRIAMQQIYHAY